jgi:hypothetical protein
MFAPAVAGEKPELVVWAPTTMTALVRFHSAVVAVARQSLMIFHVAISPWVLTQL